MANAEELSIDFLGDFNYEDFEDLKSFEPYNPGTHVVTLNWEAKKINGKNNYVANFKLVETKQQSDPAAPAQQVGHECGTSFNLENETGRGFFKQVLKVLHEKFGESISSAGGDPKSVTALVQASQGAEVLIVTGIRPDPNDADKKYLKLKSMAFV